MNSDATISQAVGRFLNRVGEHLAHRRAEEKREILSDLESHIYEALQSRTQDRQPSLEDIQSVLAEMDPPETYTAILTPEHEERKPSTPLVTLSLLCAGLQILGLGLTILGTPLVGGITGFAAVVNFFVIWSWRSPKWLILLTGIAAICGLGTIIMEIARAL